VRGDDPQRDGGARRTGLHHPAAYERRPDPDRQGLPAVRGPALGDQAAVRGRAAGDRDLPGRRLRPRRRGAADGPPAGPAHQAGRAGPIPVADQVRGAPHRAGADGAAAAAAGTDHRLRARGTARGGTARAARGARGRAILKACLDGRRLSEAESVVAELPERVQPGDRHNAAAVFSMILDTLVERHDERVVVSGAANLTPADFSQGLREVLESLEEQVVLMRLLGESADEAAVTVTIGAENRVEGLRSMSLVATAYGGTGEQALARLGVIGPTRMDYPTAIGAVRTVARYVSQILAGS